MSHHGFFIGGPGASDDHDGRSPWSSLRTLREANRRADAIGGGEQVSFHLLRDPVPADGLGRFATITGFQVTMVRGGSWVESVYRGSFYQGGRVHEVLARENPDEVGAGEGS